MKRTILIVGGVAVLVALLAGAAFVAGRMWGTEAPADDTLAGLPPGILSEGETTGATMMVEIEGARELPQRPPDALGVFGRREDNRIFVSSSGQGVMIMLDGGAVSDPDATEVEVVVTSETAVYEDVTRGELGRGPAVRGNHPAKARAGPGGGDRREQYRDGLGRKTRRPPGGRDPGLYRPAGDREVTMKRSLVIAASVLGLILLLAGGAFVAGRLLGAGSETGNEDGPTIKIGTGKGPLVEAQWVPAEECPAADPDVAGAYARRQDNASLSTRPRTVSGSRKTTAAPMLSSTPPARSTKLSSPARQPSTLIRPMRISTRRCRMENSTRSSALARSKRSPI